MQVTQLGAEGLKRDYKIVVDSGNIEDKLNERLRTLGRNVRMRGFRPGKVPLSLLKKLHGKSLMGEVLEETVSETSQKLLNQEDIRAAMQPRIENVKFEEGNSLEFTLSVEILPQFEIGDFGGISLERLVTSVSDDDIEEFLARVARQQKRFTAAPAENHEARPGDAVLINFVGRTDGRLFEGGSGTDYLLELGSGLFIPGFEEQLEGAKAGDKINVSVRFPEEYSSEELAGKDAEFEVDIKEVQIAEEAEINDELATRLGLDDLEALKKVATEQIGAEHGRLSRLKLKRALLDALAERYDFDVPPGMLDLEFEMIWSEFLRDLDRQGVDFTSLGKPEAEIKEEYRAIAERRVRLGLLLSEIGRQNNIDIRQDELTRVIAEEARRNPGNEKKVFDYYKENPEALSRLRAPLLEDKVVNFILEMVKVADREVSREELLFEPEDDEVMAARKKTPPKKAKKAPKAPKAPKATKTKKAKKTSEPAGAAAKKATAKKKAAKPDKK